MLRAAEDGITQQCPTAIARADTLDLWAVGSVDRYANGVTAMKGIADRRLHLTVAVHAAQVLNPSPLPGSLHRDQL